MKTAIENFFFRFMGVSGWLYLLFMVVSGVAYSPYNRTHELLFLEWFIVLVIWQCARWGHLAEEFLRRKMWSRAKV